MSTVEGEKLIEQCEEHLLATMRGLPECAPDAAAPTARHSERQRRICLSPVAAGFAAPAT